MVGRNLLTYLDCISPCDQLAIISLFKKSIYFLGCQPLIIYKEVLIGSVVPLEIFP